MVNLANSEQLRALQGYSPVFHILLETHQKINKVQRWWRHFRNLIPRSNMTLEDGQSDNGSDSENENNSDRLRNYRFLAFGRKEIFVRSAGQKVLCPLSLEPILIENCIKLVSPSGGSVVAYDAHLLMRYFASTAKFECPLTRRTFDTVEVARITKKKQGTAMEHIDFKRVYAFRSLISSRIRSIESEVELLTYTCVSQLNQILDMIVNKRPEVDVLRHIHETTLREISPIMGNFTAVDPKACMDFLDIQIDRFKNAASRIRREVMQCAERVAEEILLSLQQQHRQNHNHANNIRSSPSSSISTTNSGGTTTMTPHRSRSTTRSYHSSVSVFDPDYCRVFDTVLIALKAFQSTANLCYLIRVESSRIESGVSEITSSLGDGFVEDPFITHVLLHRRENT